MLSLSKTNLLRTCILDRINERVLTSVCEKRVTIFRFFETIDRFGSVENFIDRLSHEIKIYLFNQKTRFISSVFYTFLIIYITNKF